jgi:SAM-dependent methyltransferase
MSHPKQQEFVKKLSTDFPQNFNNVKMLEVGSLNINGTMRIHFKDSEYVGVDVDAGKDVDLVCEGQLVDHADGIYDTTGSCNCFEHNPFWVETFQNMYRMTKKDGLVFITVPTTGAPEHGTSNAKPEDSPLTVGKGWEYYKNLTEEDFRTNFDMDSMFHTYKFETNDTPELFFQGFKK